MADDQMHSSFAEKERKQAEPKTDSAHFMDMGRTYTPRRDELAEALCDLIPATEDEAHTGVEIRTGERWLSEAILRRYPNVRMIGLDGSETMLRPPRHESCRSAVVLNCGRFAWRSRGG
jgi:hypothetical protein